MNVPVIAMVHPIAIYWWAIRRRRWAFAFGPFAGVPIAGGLFAGGLNEHQIIHESNGVDRITVNKQMTATICASSERPFAELFLIKLIKRTVKFVLK